MRFLPDPVGLRSLVQAGEHWKMPARHISVRHIIAQRPPSDQPTAEPPSSDRMIRFDQHGSGNHISGHKVDPVQVLESDELLAKVNPGDGRVIQRDPAIKFLGYAQQHPH